MRAIASLATSLALFVPLAGSALAHPPSILSEREEKATAEEVVEFRKTVSRAIEKKDAAALRKIYADGFAHTTGKVDDKKARIAAVLAGDPVIETAPVTDLVIRVPGGWTAIVRGVSAIASKGDGKTARVRWTAVYVRAGDSWQIAASHATRLEDEK
jgi:ketosteroid isomerase-like protein